MDTPLLPAPTDGPTTLPAPPLTSRARAYAREAHAANTRRAYAADWTHFTTWCTDQALDALPAAPETLALYLTAHADTHALATLRRRSIAVGQAHLLAGLASPTRDPAVRLILRGIARSKTEAGQNAHRAAPLLLDTLIRILAQIDASTLLGARDNALLLLGFVGAFRRSELVALDVSDISFTTEGAIAHVRASKTDQEGRGFEKALPRAHRDFLCPVQAIHAWLSRADITSGPLFRPVGKGGRLGTTRLSDRAVSLIIKRRAEAAGFDAERFAGHSLRAGFVTEALIQGASYAHVQRQTGHRSLATVGIYDRDEARFRNNAAIMLGL